MTMRCSRVGCLCCYVLLGALDFSFVLSAPSPKVEPSLLPGTRPVKPENDPLTPKNIGIKEDSANPKDHFNEALTKTGASDIQHVLNSQDLDKKGGGFGHDRDRTSLKRSDSELKTPHYDSQGLINKSDQPVANTRSLQRQADATLNRNNKMAGNEHQSLKSRDISEAVNTKPDTKSQFDLVENESQSLGRNMSENIFPAKESTMLPDIEETTSSYEDIFTTNEPNNKGNEISDRKHNTTSTILSNSIPRIPSDFSEGTTSFPLEETSSETRIDVSGHDNFNQTTKEYSTQMANKTATEYPTQIDNGTALWYPAMPSQLKQMAKTEKTNQKPVTIPHEIKSQNVMPENSVNSNATVVNNNSTKAVKDMPHPSAPEDRGNGAVKIPLPDTIISYTNNTNNVLPDAIISGAKSPQTNSTRQLMPLNKPNGEPINLHEHPVHNTKVSYTPEAIPKEEDASPRNNWNDTKLTISLYGERDSVLVSWSLDTNSSDISGYVVSYRMNDREDYDSSKLGKNVRDFTLHSLHLDEDYDICVHVMVNSTTVKTECAHWSESSMKIVVGILAGTIFLIPCIIIIVWILYKDKKMRKKIAAYDKTDQENAAEQTLMMHDHSEHSQHDHGHFEHPHGKDQAGSNHHHLHQTKPKGANEKSGQKINGRTTAQTHESYTKHLVNDKGHENDATNSEDEDYEKNGPWRRMNLKEAHQRYSDIKSQQSALQKDPASIISASNQTDLHEKLTLNETPLDQAEKLVLNEKKTANSSQGNLNHSGKKKSVLSNTEHTQDFPHTNELPLLSVDKRLKQTLTQGEISTDSSQLNGADCSFKTAKDNSNPSHVQNGDTVFT